MKKQTPLKTSDILSGIPEHLIHAGTEAAARRGQTLNEFLCRYLNMYTTEARDAAERERQAAKKAVQAHSCAVYKAFLTQWRTSTAAELDIFLEEHKRLPDEENVKILQRCEMELICINALIGGTDPFDLLENIPCNALDKAGIIAGRIDLVICLHKVLQEP